MFDLNHGVWHRPDYDGAHLSFRRTVPRHRADMSPRLIRLWLAALAAMLVWGVAAVCSAHGLLQASAPTPTVAGAASAGGGVHACAEPSAAAACHDHCLTGSGGDEPSAAVHAPVAVAISAFARHYIRVPIIPAQRVAASAPLIVGPPLTILFGHLRN